MTEPVAPGTLTSLTPQISLDAGIAAVSANRVVHFDETVRMVEQLNVVLPNAHTNAVSANEAAEASTAAKNAALNAKTDAESARDASIAAKNAAEAAASGVGNPVSKGDKATAADVNAGTVDKWVDAAVLKGALDGKQAAGNYATAQSVSELSQRVDDSATKTGIESLSNKTLVNAKEAQTNWGAANTINPLTASNGTVRPTGAISFTVGASTSGVDVGKSAIVAITPSAAVTFTANAAVKWPGTGVAPTLIANRTYILSLANMQIGTSFFWFANIAGPY